MKQWCRYCDAYICYCRLQSSLKRHAFPRPRDASMLIKIPSWGVDPTMTPNKNRNQKRKRGPFLYFRAEYIWPRFCVHEWPLLWRILLLLLGDVALRRISTLLDIVRLKDESSDDVQLTLPNMAAHRFLITRIVIVNEASQSYPDEMMTRYFVLIPAHLSSSPHWYSCRHTCSHSIRRANHRIWQLARNH